MSEPDAMGSPPALTGKGPLGKSRAAECRRDRAGEVEPYALWPVAVAEDRQGAGERDDGDDDVHVETPPPRQALREGAAQQQPQCAAAIRDLVLQILPDSHGLPPGPARGTLGYLAAISPTVHRLALELTDRLATALAAAISDTTPVTPEIARIQGIALAGVFQILISESGRRLRDGETPAEIADALRPEIENVLAELDRWQTPRS